MHKSLFAILVFTSACQVASTVPGNLVLDVRRTSITELACTLSNPTEDPWLLLDSATGELQPTIEVWSGSEWKASLVSLDMLEDAWPATGISEATRVLEPGEQTTFTAPVYESTPSDIRIGVCAVPIGQQSDWRTIRWYAKQHD